MRTAHLSVAAAMMLAAGVWAMAQDTAKPADSAAAADQAKGVAIKAMTIRETRERKLVEEADHFGGMIASTEVTLAVSGGDAQKALSSARSRSTRSSMTRALTLLTRVDLHPHLRMR